MQISIGTSVKTDASAAVAEATAKLSECKFIILLSSFEMLEEASELVSNKYPNVPTIGCGSISYFDSESSDKRLVLIGFGNDAEVQVGVIRNLSTAPMLDVPTLEEKVSKIQASDGNTICLEFCSNDEERLVTTLNVALEKYRIPIVGGTIFGAPEGYKSKAMVNGKFYEDACCYALIKNKSGKIRTYSELIFGPMANPTSHIATKVNLSNKEVITLDNKPAADVYGNDANVSRSQLVDNILTNPLGRVIGEQIFVCRPY